MAAVEARDSKPVLKRILFVDDDTNVLAGYQRLFRSMRGQWQMSFCDSGAEALELIRTNPYDVLVTDLQMPGIGGIELLVKVVAINPGIARIVLTGYANATASVEVAEYAHQCLSKPCDVGQLREAIKNSCYIQSLITSEALKRAIGRVGRLPSAPALYHRLSTELRRESATSASVAALIEQDISIAAKLLQLVNSAFFGLRREVSSLEQAVSLLGLRQVRDIVLATHVFDAFPVLPKATGFSFDRLRQESVLVGRLARRIAIDIGVEKGRAEQAFLGGLLHDFGILLLASNWPDKYTRLLVKAREKTAPLFLAEKAYLQITHAEAGAYVLGLWQIPPAVVAAVLMHHHPSGGMTAGNDIALAVHCADSLLHQLDGDATGHFGSLLDTALIERLGYTDRLPLWRSWQAEVVEESRSTA